MQQSIAYTCESRGANDYGTSYRTYLHCDSTAIEELMPKIFRVASICRLVVAFKLKVSGENQHYFSIYHHFTPHDSI